MYIYSRKTISLHISLPIYVIYILVGTDNIIDTHT